MMGNDPPAYVVVAAEARRQPAIAADPVVANLRRAYAKTLSEPLPQALAALLRRLE